MKIQQFQGGLATRLRPQFLQLNQGVVYTNIDNSVGTLTPVKKSLASGISLEQYHTWYDSAQEWVDSTVRRDYVEYSGDLYWTDRVSQPQKYDGTTQTNLGTAVPPKLASFTLNSVAPVKEIEAEGIAGSGLPNLDTDYVAVNVSGSKQSSPLAFTVKENNSITTTPVTLISSWFAVAESALVNFAKQVTSSTKDIVIKNPVGFTIGSGGVNVYRLYQGTYRLVGNLATSSSTLTDNIEDISANAALDESLFNELQGVYQYQLTYYNSSDGTESGPSPLSAELDLEASGTVSLASIPISTDPQVDKKRLYRVGGNLTSPTLIVELSNTTTSYVDNTSDADTLVTILDTASALPAPAGLAFLTEAYAMLFGAIGSKLRFTPIGKVDQWPELNFLQFDADITGIAAVTSGLLIFTKFKTFIVTGTGPISLSQQVLTTNQGCLAFESVQAISGAALWVSSDGICVSSGEEPSVITKDPLGKLSLDVIDSVVYDEVYYVLKSDNTMLAFDFGYGKVFKAFDLANGSLVVANNILYGWLDGELYQLFGSTENEVLKYTSPRYIEGSVVEQKTYKNVRLYHKGDIIVKVFIDDTLVVTQVMTGEDATTIKVPQDKLRGNFIQFEIEGTGEVYEIEYITGSRHNA